MVGDKLKNYILLFLLFSNLIFSMTLSDVKGAENLKNYDLIKNIRIERIAEAEYYGSNSQIKRRGGIAYFKGETKPYKGVLISKDNGKILAIYFYENGKVEGNGFEYYSNGKLRCNSKIKNDMDIFNECYNENGSKKYTFKGNGGKEGIVIVYYEKSNNKSHISEVIQEYDFEKGEFDYIQNGKTTVYERNGSILGELNFNNGSLLGERQKLYKNGKVKYDFIGGTKDIKGLKAMRSYIEYYDNSDIMKYSCDEVSKDNWKCKEYSKDGSFKQNVDGRKYVSVNNNHHGNIWINIFLGAWNILNP